MSSINLIAIVDDDEVHQFTLKKQIEFSGLSEEIIVFSDGEEVFKHFEANLENQDRIPEVIFLDINMPIMDGWDFVSEFKRLKSSIDKEVSIYMVSSSIREEDIRRAKGIPEISDYIVKPISSQTLFNLIQVQTYNRRHSLGLILIRNKPNYRFCPKGTLVRLKCQCACNNVKGQQDIKGSEYPSPLHPPQGLATVDDRIKQYLEKELGEGFKIPEVIDLVEKGQARTLSLPPNKNENEMTALNHIE